MDLRWILGSVCVVIAIILGFLFPAYLIDALKLTDEEKARQARGKACASFGFLVIFFIFF